MKYYAVYAEGSGTSVFFIVDQEVWDWIHSEEEGVPESIVKKYNAYHGGDDVPDIVEIASNNNQNNRAILAPPIIIKGFQSDTYVRLRHFNAFCLKYKIKIEDEFSGVLY